jgi:hypothetical protein
MTFSANAIDVESYPSRFTASDGNTKPRTARQLLAASRKKMIQQMNHHVPQPHERTSGGVIHLNHKLQSWRVYAPNREYCFIV